MENLLNFFHNNMLSGITLVLLCWLIIIMIKLKNAKTELAALKLCHLFKDKQSFEHVFYEYEKAKDRELSLITEEVSEDYFKTEIKDHASLKNCLLIIDKLKEKRKNFMTYMIRRTLSADLEKLANVHTDCILQDDKEKILFTIRIIVNPPVRKRHLDFMELVTKKLQEHINLAEDENKKITIKAGLIRFQESMSKII